MNLDELIFSELRVCPVTVITEQLTDGNMIKAMTVNEELNNLGYTLNPADIIKLAKSIELNDFYNNFVSLLGDVKGKPVYPDFPNTVMNMDEATFRFHQLMHYISIDVVEWFTGQPVSKGWLPETSDTEKTVSDTKLLKSKTIELIDTSKGTSIEDYAYRKILSKRERMTDKDARIIGECLNVCSLKDIANINIPFKENIIPVFREIFFAEIDNVNKLTLLHNICQHTGDVYKCIEGVISKCNWHFRTTQKRLLVKLLESYSPEDFRTNIIISNKKAERVNLLIQYLDYNKYSRSFAHAHVVNEFRSSQLKSWESTAKRLVESHDKNALSFVCSRPGTALRWLTYLLRNGYTEEQISDNLVPLASKLNTGTLVTIYDKFREKLRYISEYIPTSKTEVESVLNIVDTALKHKLTSIDTPIKNKKVYIESGAFDIEHSVLLTNDKSDEGGYVRSGISYKIPENVKRLRFFVYWNNSARTDVDLHSKGLTVDGKPFEVGWDAAYMSHGTLYSGDVRHSDAAEYIDIDLSDKEIKYVRTDIDVYSISNSGGATFKNIEECYVGCMAVDSIGAKVKLYNPANCFFTHYLKGNYKTIKYGFINVPDKCITFIGQPAKSYSSIIMDNTDYYASHYRLSEYIDTLITSQNATLVDSEDAADCVIILDKPNTDKEISLIDNNFFIDA